MDAKTEISVALPLAVWTFLLEATAAAPLPQNPREEIMRGVRNRIDEAVRALAPSPEFSPGVPQVNLPE